MEMVIDGAETAVTFTEGADQHFELAPGVTARIHSGEDVLRAVTIAHIESGQPSSLLKKSKKIFVTRENMG